MCCGGYIPVEISARIFELIAFEEYGDATLVKLIIYMLMIKQNKILSIKEECERFKYISHGQFIIDCIGTEETWDQLIKEYIEVDLIFVEEAKEDDRNQTMKEFIDDAFQFDEKTQKPHSKTEKFSNRSFNHVGGYIDVDEFIRKNDQSALETKESKISNPMYEMIQGLNEYDKTMSTFNSDVKGKYIKKGGTVV